ncbi:MAG: MFS transporter [Chloroflexi bacterium]|nr:MFS transporter [Chloroflexota bacterium]MCL5074974.1 MFS transporter [Chloroflexota bacterium]
MRLPNKIFNWQLRSAIPDEQWRRNQYAIALAVFINFTGFDFVIPFLPLYVQMLGVTDVREVALWSGILFGVNPLLASLLAPFWGRIGDLYGRKMMVQRSLFSFVVFLFLMGLVNNVWQLLILRMAIGILGGVGAMSMALVTTSCPRDKVSESVGMVQAAQVSSLAIGPLVGGMLADLLGLRHTFFIGASMCLLAAIIVTALYQERGPCLAVADEHNPQLSWRDMLRLPGFTTLVLLLFLASFVDKSFSPILPLYVAMLGTPDYAVASIAGLIISLGAVATALSAAFMGRLATRTFPGYLLPLAIGGGALLVLPIAFVQTPWQLLAARVSLGLAAGGVLTLIYSLGGSIIPLHCRGIGFGLLGSAVMLGNALSPMVSGSLASFNLRSVFVVDSVLYLLCLGWLLTVGSQVRRGLAKSR